MSDNPSPLALVADDDPDILELIGNALENAGVRADRATNGQEALDSFVSKGPDVVCSDYEMPNLRGDKLIEEIKKLRADTPIFLITGVAPKEAMIHLIRFDRVTIFTKPLKVDLLVNKMKEEIENTISYQGPERRKYRRVDCDLQVDVEGLGVCKIKNISVGGALLAIDDQLFEGEPLKVKIPALHGLVLQSSVVFSKPQGVAIQFDNITPQDISTLARYIFGMVKHKVIHDT